MLSDNQNPIGFFEYFFESGINLELDNFYKSSEEILSGSPYDNIDKVNHLMLTHDSTNNEIISYSFESYINPLIKREVRKSKRLIDFEFQKRFSDSAEVVGYWNWLSLKIGSLRKKQLVTKFNFTNKIIDSLNEAIEIYGSRVSSNAPNYSFNIISNSDEDQKAKIEKLFDLLTKAPAMIESTKEEFFNAFSGRKVNSGINWLVKGKNAKVSKVSLFYFITKLIDNSHLGRYVINDQSKFILNVFRDSNGGKLQNLKQSKSTISSSPSQSDRIDEIISKL